MHILILGATGRVGRRILEEALADGHEVTALVRSLEKLIGNSFRRLIHASRGRS